MSKNIVIFCSFLLFAGAVLAQSWPRGTSFPNSTGERHHGRHHGEGGWGWHQYNNASGTTTFGTGNFGEEAQRRQFINKYDKNGDGVLSPEELQAAHQARQRDVMNQFDTNGDGYLDDFEKAAMQEYFRKQQQEKEKQNSPPPGIGQPVLIPGS